MGERVVIRDWFDGFSEDSVASVPGALGKDGQDELGGDNIISRRVTWEGGGRTARLKVASQLPGVGGGAAAPACGRSEKEILDSWGAMASEGQVKGQEPSMETWKWSESCHQAGEY